MDENDYVSILAGLGRDCLGAMKIVYESDEAINPEFRELSAFSRFISYIVPNLIHSMCCAALFLYSRNFQKTAVKRQVYFIKSVLYFGQLSKKIAFAALESGMSVSIGPILCRNASHRVRRKNYRQPMYRIHMLSLHNPSFT